MTITADDIDIDNDGVGEATITGGTGSDTLTILADAGNDAIEAADIDNITKIETFQFTQADGVTARVDLTIADANAGYTHATSYDTLTIDATATTGVSTIDLTAETDAKIILNTGTGADVLTSTSQSTSVIPSTLVLVMTPSRSTTTI